VPEKIEATAQDQAPTGETHDLPHLLSVTRPEAMDVAMLAGRLRVEGAPDSAGKGVLEKLPALAAEMKTLQSQALQSRFADLKRYPFVSMPGPAINGGEQGKNL
jgi:hypothetical protein